MKTLYLIRGLPGSGKSTLAREIRDGIYAQSVPNDDRCVKWLEADQFFTRGGSYVFDPALIGRAHIWCQGECDEAMAQGAIVIVSNTFTRQWELTPYLELAQEHGYNVTMIAVDSGLTDDELAARNVHHVPSTTIKKMRERWEQ